MDKHSAVGYKIEIFLTEKKNFFWMKLLKNFATHGQAMVGQT